MDPDTAASSAECTVPVLRCCGENLVDGFGSIVKLNGINWFGFNTGTTMVDGLWGSDPLVIDFASVVLRQKLLGFNAIRLPFSFHDLHDLPPKNFWSTVPRSSDAKVAASVLPPGVKLPDAVKVEGLPAPPQSEGLCNDYLPHGTTLERFVWVVRFYAANGFYVLLDNHVREDQTMLRDPAAWAQKWADLVMEVARDPVTAGRLLVDIMNEPDNYSLRWAPQTNGTPGLMSLYLRAMDAIHAVDPGVVFLVEGGGQQALGTNWGDGFATDTALVEGLGLSDPRPFFEALTTKPYQQQVVLSPHVYGPFVTKAPTAWAGQDLYDRLTASFGYATVGEGINGQRFPVAIGEFGSFFASVDDMATLLDLTKYMTRSDGASAETHAVLDNWFFWCWNRNSGDTGGLVTADWRELEWEKVTYLTLIGLRPWFMDWETPPKTPPISVLPSEGPSCRVTLPRSCAIRRHNTHCTASVSATTGSSGYDGAPTFLKRAEAARPAVRQRQQCNSAVPFLVPPIELPGPGNESFEVTVEVGDPWPEGCGIHGAALEFQVRNLGTAPVGVPWVLSAKSPFYCGIANSWNCAAVFSEQQQTLQATAPAEWQLLFPGGGNQPTCGAVVHSKGSDFLPELVTVNGLPAKVFVRNM